MEVEGRGAVRRRKMTCIIYDVVVGGGNDEVGSCSLRCPGAGKMG